MSKKFLDKVINQIVIETEIDYDDKVVHTPFTSPSLGLITLPSSSHIFTGTHVMTPNIFDKHCKDIYGLIDYEVEYVWYVYQEIIKNKIISNG